jgi:hypothetical protein
MTGLMAAVTIKKATLVLCVNTLSVEQWREHFVKYTTVDFKHVHVVCGPTLQCHLSHSLSCYSPFLSLAPVCVCARAVFGQCCAADIRASTDRELPPSGCWRCATGE